MQELRQKLMDLVRSLFISEKEKQRLLEQIEQQGPVQEVIGQVQDALDGSILEYQKNTQKQITEMEKKMSELEEGFSRDMAEIEREFKQFQKDERKKKEQEEIENIKKSLQ